MRRIPLVSLVLLVLGLIFAVIAVVYFTVTAPNLPTFVPGHVEHAFRAQHYTKRGIAAAAVAIIAFAAAFVVARRK